MAVRWIGYCCLLGSVRRILDCAVLLLLLAVLHHSEHGGYVHTAISREHTHAFDAMVSWQVTHVLIGNAAVVFFIGVGVRLAAGERVDACGALQDLNPALHLSVVFTLLRQQWLLPLEVVVLSILFAADLSLRLTAGVRLHLATILFVLDQCIDPSRWPALLSNVAMAANQPTLSTMAVTLAVGALLVKLSRCSVRSTPFRLAAAALSSATAVTTDQYYCHSTWFHYRGDGHTPNVLNQLVAEFVFAIIGEAGAPSELGVLALKLERDAMLRHRAGAKHACTHHKDKNMEQMQSREACRRPSEGGLRTRNVVLITLESVGAQYVDLYNRGVETMPFLTSLFNASAPGHAFMVDHYYGSEPNTLHSLFAMLCGMRPSIGAARREYHNNKQRVDRCLPAQLRAAGIHTGFYTSSNAGGASFFGFDDVWSAVEAFPPKLRDNSLNNAHTRRKPRPISWPDHWWHVNSNLSEELRPSSSQYNWLGHHDVYSLPAVRDFIRARGEHERFFLQLLTVAAHSPYVGVCPLASRGVGRKRRSSDPALGKIPHAQGSRERLRSFVKELRCVDWYLEEVHGILRRAGRLHDTSIIIIGDHGEGFGFHAGDRVHGGAIWESQARLPLIAFGPIAKGLPKHLSGIWSDMSLAPTLLEALTGSTGSMEVGRMWAPPTTTSKHSVQPLGIELSVHDLFGRSMLSMLSFGHLVPRHTFLSCAFESTCVGLVLQSATSGVVTKFISWSSQQDQEYLKFLKRYSLQTSQSHTPLEAYDLSANADEKHSHASSIPERVRASVIETMHAWARAVQDLHQYHAL